MAAKDSKIVKPSSAADLIPAPPTQDHSSNCLNLPARVTSWHKLKIKLDLTAEQTLLGKKSERAIAKILAAREARWALAKCLSTEPLENAYQQIFGKVWSQDFIRMSTDPDDLIEAWNSLINSRASRFLRAFCTPDQLAIPKFVNEEFNYNYLREQLNQVSLVGLPTSPLRFSEVMLERLGALSADDLKACEKDPISRLQLISTPRVAAIVKQVFQSAEQIESGNYRIQRIELPNPQTREQYSHLIPDYQLPDALAGSIIYTSEDSALNKTIVELCPVRLKFEPLKVQIFTTLYDALRKTQHVNERNQEEITELSAYCERLENIRDRIKKSWDRDTAPELKKELQDDLSIVLRIPPKTFNRPKTKAKREAKISLDKLQEQIESGRLINPVASVNRLLGVLNRLYKRTQRVPHTGKWNTLDRDTMLRLLATAHQGFADINQQVQRCREALRAHWPCIDPSKESKSAKQANRALLRGKFRFPELERQAFKFRPFRTFSQAIHALIQQVDRAIESRTPRANLEKLIQGLSIVCRLQQANMEIGKLRAAISYKRLTDIPALQHEWQQIKNIVDQPLPFTERNRPTGNLHNIFEAFQRSVTTAAIRIAALSASNPDKDTTKERLERINAFLEHFNPEILLLKLKPTDFMLI